LRPPRYAHQLFTVTELNTTEAEAKYFQPPEGYRIVDHRKPDLAPAQSLARTGFIRQTGS
jgi:hypothetical protein